MPTTIITKYGSGAPTTSDVVQGELAVDTTNGRLYTLDGSSVIEIGLNPSGNVDVTGTVTADGLTVDGGNTIRLNPSSGDDFLTISQGTADANITADSTAGNANLKLFTTASGTTRERLDISFNGDISFYEDTGTNAKLFWDASAESLGIGTTSPTADLSVGSTTTSSGDIHLRTTKTAAEITPSNTDAGGLDIDVGWVSGGQGPLTFSLSGSEKMRIDASGNLLVGKTSTSGGIAGSVLAATGLTRLTASGIAVAEINRLSSDGSIVDFKKDGSTVGSIGANGGDVYIGTGDTTIRFADGDDAVIPRGTAGAARDGAIDLGISNNRFKDLYLSGGVSTNTTTGLSITADATNRGILNLSTSQSYQLLGGAYYGYTGYKTGGYHRWFGSDGAEDMRLDSSGNLQVGFSSYSSLGTVNTGCRLSADGETNALARGSNGTVLSFYSGSGGAGYISVSGSSATYNTSSDQRLKDNIVDAPSASDDIDAIQVRSFDWKVDGSHQKYGMVAQELVTVAPEAVSQPEDPEEMMGVDYSKLVPMLVKEVQQLRARVAQLEGAN